MFYNCFTIGIDLDDTFEGLLPAWIAWLNAKYNLNVLLEDFTEWNVQKIYPSLTAEQIFEPLHLPEFWQTVKPKPGAVEYIRKLINEGQDIYIVTSSKYTTFPFKLDEALFKYLPELDYHNVIVTYQKQLIKLDILVDDGYHNLENGDYIRILFDAPHNQNIEENAVTKCKRVKSWEEVYNFIKHLDWFYTINGLSTIKY